MLVISPFVISYISESCVFGILLAEKDQPCLLRVHLHYILHLIMCSYLVLYKPRLEYRPTSVVNNWARRLRTQQRDIDPMLF